PRLQGYAVIWDSLSLNLGGFKERIRKGAFVNSLAKDDQRALFNHESSFVLGRVSAGTLTLKEDVKGLLFSIVPPDTTWAKDLQVSIRRRDITQCSFGFTVDPNGDTWSRQGTTTIREVLKATLAEVTIASFPAYEATTVMVRQPMDPKVQAELRKRADRLEALLIGV
ncbi:MAG: HK97 family phage prohead protease, partial [Nitrospirales bacterium]